MKRVAIVSLGRGIAMGEVRRVASWRQIFVSAGAEVVEVPVAPTRRPHVDGIVSVVSGRAVPERLAWSGARLRDALRAERPDAVVVVSTRAFDAAASIGSWTIVLDLVDTLSRSYRDRAAVVDGIPRRTMYRALASAHRRVEHRLTGSGIRRVAAGWTDAHALDAEWVPNTTDPTLVPVDGRSPDHDVLFFGTLRYPPNLDALERLDRIWPLVLSARPGTTALVAGAAPPPRVAELCARNRWELVADFASLSQLAARARVAVAPLTRVAGIQNKVLDAATLGLPQVVTPAALEGFAPGLPLPAPADDAAFAAEIVRVLDDRAGALAAAATLRDHVHREYSAARWSDWARALLDSS
ncbi:MAG: polysaccharide biosynthesis protein PslH [Acidimicrobiaceae bacterium]